ncbi:MAG: hypothetical protein AAGB26_14560 [Planctomycetota bacterium]
MKRAFSLLIALMLMLGLAGCGEDSAASAPPTTAAASDQTTPGSPTPELAPAEATSSSPIVTPAGTSARVPTNDKDPEHPSAFVVIQNAGSQNPQLLVQQLQQVLPKTQVVRQVQSPDAREIRLEVTNTKDVRALANKIPFASVESINDRTRTVTVDFDL